MKKIIIWTLAAILSFALLVVVIFLVLYNSQPSDPELETQAILDNEFMSSNVLEKKDLTIDSLQAVIDELNSEIFFKNLNIDSLKQITGFQEGLISEYKSSLERSTKQLTAKADDRLKMEELARTYGSMKIKEMEPILAELNDDMVLELYKYTATRNRKNILQALSFKRAAAITERMARGE